MSDQRGAGAAAGPGRRRDRRGAAMEVGDLVDSLKHVRKYQAASMPVIEGEHGGKIVAIAMSGPGRAAARRRPSS